MLGKLGVVLAGLGALGAGLGQAPRFSVQLKAVETVSSASCAVGQVVLFSTVAPFVGAGQEFEPGTVAAGTVTQCSGGRRVGRGGVLEIRFSHLQLPDGRLFPLAGAVIFRGGARALGVAGGAAAAGLLLSPFLAPAALLIKGKAAVMPAGALVVASLGSPAPGRAGGGTAAARGAPHGI